MVLRNASGVEWRYDLGNYQDVGVVEGSLVVFGENYDWDTGTIRIVKLNDDGAELWSLEKSLSRAGDLRAVGDLNGDNVDFMFLPWLAGEVFVISGANGNVLWEVHDAIAEFMNDFDGDRYGDIFYAVTETSSFNEGSEVREYDGTLIFNISSGNTLQVLCSGVDFDGDGSADLAIIRNAGLQNSIVYSPTAKQSRPLLNLRLLF